MTGHRSKKQEQSGKRRGASTDAQAALNRSEARLSAIVNTAADGIITIDSRGRIETFNPGAERIFGYRAEEVIGRNVAVLMPEPNRSRHDGYLENYLTTGEARIIGIGREVQGLRKDGREFPLYLAVSEMKLDEERMFTGIVHDLSDFKQMQQEVLRHQNLVAIGEMAASVAHEIKNPLAGIAGTIQVLRDSIETDDPRREVIGEVLELVGRMDRTVNQLLLFSKTWTPFKLPCDLYDLVKRYVQSIAERPEFRQIEFRLEGSEPLVVPADPTLLEQVLANLLTNSSDAMAAQGSIRFRFAREGDFACIRLWDSGTGIPDTIRQKLFRPFFTTKTRGTGLGLAICRKIMEAHKGTIEVHSEAGHGTEISLRIPMVEAL